MPFNTLRQRLRELTYESRAKRGAKRRELEVRSCFAPLLGWVLSKFDGQQRQLVLAMDVTHLRDGFTILAVSVVLAGCAIPVAWHIQDSHQSGEWKPIWRQPLAALQPAVSRSWQVAILAAILQMVTNCALSKN
jgi:hypothetical protein